MILPDSSLYFSYGPDRLRPPRYGREGVPRLPDVPVVKVQSLGEVVFTITDAEILCIDALSDAISADCEDCVDGKDVIGDDDCNIEADAGDDVCCGLVA